MITFGSVCSGIEAASVAWHPLGWRAAWLAEIEPFPSAVLKHHYPEVPNLGDMTTLPDRIRSGEVEAPDLFCGGTPCQAFSVAGLRRSLDDARGNLSLIFCEIADAIDDVRRAAGQPASIVFYENVPGILSTADNAFGCLLGALAGCDTAIEPLAATGWTDAGVVAGPSRAVAWRVLDAQFFALAQRRRRVFVVASARDGFDPAAVLLEWEGLRRDTPPSREARQGASRGASAGAGSGIDFQNASLSGDIAGTLDAEGQKRRNRGHGILAFGGGQNCAQTDVSTSLSAHPGGSRLDFQTETFVTQPFSIMPMNSGKDYKARETDIAQPLMAGGPVGGNQGGDFIVQPMAFVKATSPHSADEAPRYESAEVAACLNTWDERHNPPKHMVAQPVAWAIGSHAGAADGDQTNRSHASGGPVGSNISEERAYSLRGGRTQGVATAMQVRRLTPVECERLQGFPDNYTAIPWRGKPASECPDGPRYKALGNSWAVPVVRWIGRRIAASI